MMTFISMSITAYATHLVGAAVVGLAIGAGIVYAVTKTQQPKQSVKQEEQPMVEQKHLLVLENNC